MNTILSDLLKECKQYVALFQTQWNDEELRKQLTPKEKKFVEEMKQIIPDLEKLQETEVSSSGATEFSGVYNKYFAYLDKFTSVQQHNISALLQSNRLINKLQELYSHIAPETIQRQKSIMEQRKKAMDKWASTVSKDLQNEDTKQRMDKRFHGLLEKANATLSEKGMDNVHLT